jgi:hypothetical protein
MSNPPLNNPNARYWDDLVEEFDFTPQETQEITLAAYVRALGGKLKIIADFGDETYVLG